MATRVAMATHKMSGRTCTLYEVATGVLEARWSDGTLATRYDVEEARKAFVASWGRI